MSNFLLYNLIEACHETGCPVCRVEQKSVERYIENQFYESVNSPKWRERLRGSLGFCARHAWLAVDQRLGDALGFSIIYHDLLNTILARLEEPDQPRRASRHWTAALRQVPRQARAQIARMLDAITSSKRCPVCEHMEGTTRTALAVLVKGLKNPDLLTALQTSDGLCLPHVRQTFEQIGEASDAEILFNLHHQKLEILRSELAEFIRKNDYQEISQGFGREGDAWLRAIAIAVGSWTTIQSDSSRRRKP